MNFLKTDVCDLDSSEKISYMLRQYNLIPILCNCRIMDSEMTVEMELSDRSKGSIKKSVLRREVENVVAEDFLIR